MFWRLWAARFLPNKLGESIASLAGAAPLNRQVNETRLPKTGAELAHRPKIVTSSTSQRSSTAACRYSVSLPDVARRQASVERRRNRRKWQHDLDHGLRPVRFPTAAKMAVAQSDCVSLDEAGLPAAWWLEWAVADPSHQFRNMAEQYLHLVLEFRRMDDTFLLGSAFIADEIGCNIRSVSKYRSHWIALGWLARGEDGSLKNHRIEPEQAIVEAAGGPATARGCVVPAEVEAAAKGLRVRAYPTDRKTCRPTKELEFSFLLEGKPKPKHRERINPVPWTEPVSMGKRRRAAKTVAERVLFLRNAQIPLSFTPSPRSGTPDALPRTSTGFCRTPTSRPVAISPWTRTGSATATQSQHGDWGRTWTMAAH
jgi:hypothetical protein